MSILLKILKTAGKAVLWILAAAIILLLVILFCPIFYEIRGEKYEKAVAMAEVKALFGILKIKLGYDKDGMSTSVRIFGRKLKAFESGEEKADDEENEGDEKPDEPDKTGADAPAGDSGKKNDMDKDMGDRVQKAVPHAEPGNKSDGENTETTVKKAAEKNVPPKNIPEKNSLEAASVYRAKPEAEKQSGKEKEEISAPWAHEKAKEKEPIVRKIKLAEAEKPSLPTKEKEVKIKYVKMPEEEKQQETEKTDKTDRKDEKAAGEEAQTDEKLGLEYFRKMPSDERKQLIKAALRLIRSLFRGIKPRNFYLKGRLGLSDPALTGQLVGAAWSMGGMFNKRIELQAVFNEEIAEGEFSARGHIVPAFMLIHIIRFIAVKPVRKIIKLLIKGDKNGK